MTTIIPTTGIISLKDLAEVMGTDPGSVDTAFKKLKIPIMMIKNRQHLKFVSLEQVHNVLLTGAQ